MAPAAAAVLCRNYHTVHDGHRLHRHRITQITISTPWVSFRFGIGYRLTSNLFQVDLHPRDIYRHGEKMRGFCPWGYRTRSSGLIILPGLPIEGLQPFQTFPYPRFRCNYIFLLHKSNSVFIKTPNYCLNHLSSNFTVPSAIISSMILLSFLSFLRTFCRTIPIFVFFQHCLHCHFKSSSLAFSCYR